jgi:hypothetical protein
MLIETANLHSHLDTSAAELSHRYHRRNGWSIDSDLDRGEVGARRDRGENQTKELFSMRDGVCLGAIFYLQDGLLYLAAIPDVLPEGL